MLLYADVTLIDVTDCKKYYHALGIRPSDSSNVCTFHRFNNEPCPVSSERDLTGPKLNEH